ncbi:uncharacterized protein LOC143571586 [Bidens hawaiensis]|uniref:uncharacterized protein LOC143571586 n=1 Tax=Bidens hawaiensis TaxID=980011 RepID=UPI00404B4675
MDKLPKKLLDDSYAVNLISVPKKLRSGMNKRHIDQSTPNLMASADGNKKVKFNQDEHLMMKNEEEAIAGLLALAENDITNTHEIKLNNKFHDLNESRNILDVKKVNLYSLFMRKKVNSL